ncbi:MAG: ATP-binding cassette domain-containing protein [Roseburia sp.]|nr:ATP-binding cassette domain-containing protein [Roseburia sp.]
MKNKNIYLDALRWMLIPILAKTIYDILAIFVMFVTTIYLGTVTDAALNGNSVLFGESGKKLLFCMIANVIIIPILAICMDFIFIKGGTNSDVEMCSRISFWKFDRLNKLEEGEIEYKLSQELCDFRLYFATVCSDLLLIPSFVIFIWYCVEQIGFLYVIVSVACSLVVLILPILSQRFNIKYEKEKWEYEAKQNQTFIELSEETRAIYQLNIYRLFIKKWHRLFEEYFSKSRKIAIRFKNIMDGMNEGIKIFSQIVILVLGCVLAGEGYITVGCIIIMIRYLSIFENFLNRCIQIVVNFSNLREKAKRLYVFYGDLERTGGTELGERFDSLHCDKLTFKYGDNNVLKELSFEIQRGERVQIIGKNGSGKSTLINILCGFEEEYEGEILINGKSLKNINLKMWREKLAIVFQNDYIFSGTVLENVLMGASDASTECVEKAIQNAELEGIKEKKISYGANELSGGERQKTAFARAVLNDSEILILDEGDSYLDKSMKKKLYDYIVNSDQTIIFISHDEEFGELADQVICL